MRRFLGLGSILILAGCLQPIRMENVETYVSYPDGSISEMIETSLIERGAPVRLQVIYEKPKGDGPFPLLLFNHGSTGRGDDPSLFRESRYYPAIADFFVQRGWMVATPQRRGRGWSDGLYDEGFNASRQYYTCEAYRSLKGADRALADISAALNVLVRRMDVDKTRVIIGGVSRGGIISVAFAGENPQKVKGVINFVGGWISDQCSTAGVINGALARMGAAFPNQMIWIYSDGDQYYSVAHSESNFDIFTKHGGKGEFVVSGFGHGSWKQTSNWEDVVGNYMSKLGFAEFKLR